MLREHQEKVEAEARRKYEKRKSLVNVKQESTCSWMYTDKATRTEYYCTNSRVKHVLSDDQSRYCRYHQNICIREHGREGEMRKVGTPNKRALCDDCWHEVCRGYPRQIPIHKIPGVYEKSRLKSFRIAEIQSTVASADGYDSDDEAISLQMKDGATCRVTKLHPKTRREWKCCGKRIKHGMKKMLMDECGWHQKYCIGTHSEKKPPKIESPNALGLCAAHYAAATGVAPPLIENWWDIPVMKAPPPIVRVMPRRHALAPRGLPPNYQEVKIARWGPRALPKQAEEKQEIAIEPTLFEALRNALRRTLLENRVAIAVSTSAPAATMKGFLEDRKDAKWRRRKAPGAALRIQKVFRGWSHRRKTFLMLERFRFHRREFAAIHIQTMVRRCLASYHAGIYLDKRRMLLPSLTELSVDDQQDII